MSGAGEDGEEGGAGPAGDTPQVDARGLVAGDEAHVDESSLKLPSAPATFAGKEASGEEGQEVLLKQRCKLYTTVGGEWKERATGDAKLLRDPASGKVRLIVRQEKMHYLRANHFVEAELKPQFGSDKALSWAALDFGMEAAGKLESFSIKLKDAEAAKEFKSAWDAAREANRAAGGRGGAAAAPLASAAAAAPSTAAAAAAAPVTAASAPDRSGSIPVVEHLAAIYGADKEAEQAARYAACGEAFKAAYEGQAPAFFVRAPGRVNLIGEHVDYHGYSVLPMALQTQDVVIAVGVVPGGGGHVRVANVNPKWGEAGALPVDPAVEVNRAAHKWFNYVHCGYKGAFDAARVKGLPGREPLALNLMVDGRVPPGAGVSSSSALVVASCLAVARANGISDALTRADLGEAGRACELHIGTMSGGMDQAISAMGETGAASRVDFEPLRATAVALPASAAFVVANTMEVSAKAEESERRYNMRVTEGKMAAKLVAKGEGLAAWRGVATFRGLQEALKLASPGALVPAIERHLTPGAFSQAALEPLFGLAGGLPALFEGDEKKAGALKVLQAFAKDEAAFELLKRARHVCSEAERVFQFQAAAAAVGAGGEEAQLKRLGELMCASQASCRDDYECSSPGLDAVCALAMGPGAGAYGSRLTGAGWGGCAVSLVHKDRVVAFIQALRAGYAPYHGKDETFLATAVFASAPGSGAAIYTPPASFDI